MEQEPKTIAAAPPKPAPKPDLDDVIFQGEGWLISDR
jgi:hypothetical protein